MTLIIFKYCLPALLGYTLFVGIAGRLNPFKKPSQPEERPSWLLGIWTGLTVSVVLGIGLHMAYGMSLEGAKALAKPSAWLMAGLLVPGFIAYFAYRSNVKNSLTEDAKPSFDWVLESDELEFAAGLDTELAQGHLLDRGLEPHILDSAEIPSVDRKVAEAFLISVETDKIDIEDLSKAINDSDDSVSAPKLKESLHVNLESVEAEIICLDATAEQHVECLAELPMLLDTKELYTPLSDNLIDGSLHKQIEARSTLDTEQEVNELKTLFFGEQALREEAEKHLRITRKALATIESETRHYETRKADAVIELEEKLTENIKTQSALEAQATREKTKRVSVETSTVNLKQDLVKAKQEIRQSIAARAKALSTANKSIAFARQNIQIRARLESENSELQTTLKNRQTTISSLIRALEKEKRRTQDDVATMAKQLVLHEKQVTARRSLEEVAKSVEMKLSTRLVKKVARARPLISDS